MYGFCKHVRWNFIPKTLHCYSSKTSQQGLEYTYFMQKIRHKKQNGSYLWVGKFKNLELQHLLNAKAMKMQWSTEIHTFVSGGIVTGSKKSNCSYLSLQIIYTYHLSYSPSIFLLCWPRMCGYMLQQSCPWHSHWKRRICYLRVFEMSRTNLPSKNYKLIHWKKNQTYNQNKIKKPLLFQSMKPWVTKSFFQM